jgi:hypothetical protein
VSKFIARIILKPKHKAPAKTAIQIITRKIFGNMKLMFFKNK